MSGSKFCKHCNCWKPRSDFWRNADNVDGLQDWCKDCRRACPNAKRATQNYEKRRRRITVNGIRVRVLRTVEAGSPAPEAKV